MAKPRVGWAIAFFGALALLFAAILVAGLYHGELRVPSKGFTIRIERATNPIGFHLTAMFYAALAGLSSYPLLLLLQHGSDPSTPQRAPRLAPRAPVAGSGPNLDLEGRVAVTSAGRSGEMHVVLDGGSHVFWWEFGGGDCLVIVAVPTADQWTRIPVLSAYSRDAFLDALAGEVGRLQCPGARYEIERCAIVFRQ